MFLFICFIFLFATGTSGEDKNASDLFNEATIQFTAKMFSEVVKQNPAKSSIVSPFSVLQPVAQLALASKGESHDEILKVMGLPNDNVTIQAFSPIPEQLRTAKGIELKTANRIYVADGYELNEEFAETSKDVFDSEIKKVNFLQPEESANEINTWVEEKTNHRIKDLVNPESFNQNTRVVLVNAIYFKGKWLQKFDERKTVDSEFYVTKDNPVKLPTMHQENDFLFSESAKLDARVLELPYEGNDVSFYIFLPNQIDGITTLEEKLKDPSTIFSVKDNMRKVTVDLSLPKFKIETTTDLRDILIKMGAGKMFDSTKARLDNLLKSPANLFVSEANQKAFIEINEEGAEAAAANYFTIHTRSEIIRPRIEFHANRPFYYVLMYQRIPLFCGVYAS